MSNAVLPFTLRAARPEDAPALVAIYAHYVLTHTATFELDPPDATEMARRVEDVQARGLPWWVASSDQALLGYCYVTPYRTRPAYRHTLEDSVYIAPAHVGRGLGRALLTKVLGLCQAQGYRELIAVIGDSANLPSIRLHERLGFRHIGTHTNVGFKFERWLDTVHMQRSLI